MNSTVVLITGVSGSGKTAIAGQLREFGYDATSLDGYPDLCSWIDHNGKTVSRPDAPTHDWLARHRWWWSEPVLRRLIADKRQLDTDVVWMTGIAANTIALKDWFDLRILLRVDEPTMLDRIRNPRRSNTFGRTPATEQLLRNKFPGDQAALAGICDAHVDATLPLEAVGHELLLQVSLISLRAGTRRSGERQ